MMGNERRESYRIPEEKKSSRPDQRIVMRLIEFTLKHKGRKVSARFQGMYEAMRCVRCGEMKYRDTEQEEKRRECPVSGTRNENETAS